MADELLAEQDADVQTQMKPQQKHSSIPGLDRKVVNSLFT